LASQCTPLDEIRKFLIVFKRRLSAASQREPACSECYRKVLEMIEELEARGIEVRTKTLSPAWYETSLNRV